MFDLVISGPARDVDRLPLSWRSFALRRGYAFPLLFLFAWVWFGAVLGTLIAVALVLLWAMSMTRAIVLDDSGIRFVPLVGWLPSLLRPREVAWSTLDRFEVHRPWMYPNTMATVRYSQLGKVRRRRAIQPEYAPVSGARALDVEQLCNVLNARLHQWRTTFG